MTRKICRKIVLLFLLMLASVCTDVAADVPLEVYGRLPSITNMSLSPDGTHIAFTMTTEDDRFICIVSVPDLQVKRSMALGKVKLRRIAWADNRRVLFLTTITDKLDGFTGSEGEYAMLRVLDIVTGKSENPIHATSFFPVMNVIIDTPMLREIDGETIIYVAGIYISDYTLPALFELNLNKGTSDLVELGGRSSQGWLVDENGTVVTSETYEAVKRRWTISVRKGGEMVEAASGVADIERPTVAGFAPAGNVLWVADLENSDVIWKPLSLESGELGKALPEVIGFDGLAKNPRTGRIFGGSPIGTDSDFVFFDSELQEIWEKVQDLFPGERIDLASASEDFKKMVIVVDGHVHGYGYYLFDAVSWEFFPLGNKYSNLSQIAETQSIHYAARDGMTIPAFLTLPTGREPKGLPLVVLPHGGPASRDTAHFDWWAQALASTGYAVLQPNFRGSDLGWKYISTGFGEWGRKMQTDLSDGVRHLVQEGIVDEKRVAIAGASYGGYAALAGATLDQDVYNCAVSLAGISDLVKFYKFIRSETGSRDSVSDRYLDRFLGVSGINDPLLEELSPCNYASDVKIPIMLIHGKDDTVVPYIQSKIMAKALKRAKKNYELVKLKDEDHWLSRSETRLEMLESMVSFLKKYNPPD
jgi:pimeloyl-ACP methyl ester carboxylesterase